MVPLRHDVWQLEDFHWTGLNSRPRKFWKHMKRQRGRIPGRRWLQAMIVSLAWSRDCKFCDELRITSFLNSVSSWDAGLKCVQTILESCKAISISLSDSWIFCLHTSISWA
jgi:hypothetical protein